MNKLFAIIFIAAISFLVFTGRSELASNSLLEIPLEGIKLVINTSASVMLFSGLLQVAYDCGIIKHLTSFLRNPMSHLFLSLNNDDIDTFTNMVWENLNEDNKVSLFVRFIDIKTGEYETRIINKNK